MNECFVIHKLLEEDAAHKYGPICVQDLKFNSEWMPGMEEAADEFVYKEGGLTWMKEEQASRVPEHSGPTTRSGQVLSFIYQIVRMEQRLARLNDMDAPLFVTETQTFEQVLYDDA